MKDKDCVKEKIQYFNPDTERWVDKLPKKFINRIVKTRWIKL